MAQKRNQNSRVYGTSISKQASSAGPRGSTLGLTPAQKAQREKETQASYENWRREREARKAKRYQAMRSRNMGL